MLLEVLACTNEKIKEYRSRYADKTRTELRDTTVTEMRAFIGLLYYTAIFKSNKENLESLFATDGTGRDIFRCTLSLKRILVLLICHRFDNGSTTFTTSRRTRRWPMAMYFGILNIAGVNSHVLHSAFRDNSSLSRSDFLKGLSRQLCEPYLSERLLNTRLPRELRVSIGRILNKPVKPSGQKVGPTKRKRCSLCPRSSDKKTEVVCVNCNRHICVSCRRSICFECVDE